MKLPYHLLHLPLILTFTHSCNFSEPYTSHSRYSIYRWIWTSPVFNVHQRALIQEPNLLLDVFGEDSDAETSDEEGFDDLIHANVLNSSEFLNWRDEESVLWEAADLEDWSVNDESLPISGESNESIVLDLPNDLDPDSTNFKKWWNNETQKRNNVALVKARSGKHSTLHCYRVVTQSKSLLTLHMNFNKQVPITSKNLLTPVKSTLQSSTTKLTPTYSLKLTHLVASYLMSLKSPQLLTTLIWSSYNQFLVNLLQSGFKVPSLSNSLNNSSINLLTLKSFNKKFM